MKVKYNKKRNTAFVYEALVREATIAILKGEHKKKAKIVEVIKKHFSSCSVLSRDLECYRSLYENQNLDQEMAEKVLKEARMQKMIIDTQGLFARQTELIHDVNKEINPEVYNNFVPNYKTLATIGQIFSSKTSPKNRVIMESQIINNMARKPEQEVMDSIDNVTYRTFVKKFNNKYNDGLLGEQKDLLTHYIASFADNALELKIFLNKEIGRLKSRLHEAKNIPEIKDDGEMLRKSNEVLARLNSLSEERVTENVLLTVLKTQALVEEIHNVDND
tara:strand:+ start:8775 stop:9602 length:828 start_codon:yes stop_codon:yes gene_type:complete